MPAGHPLTEEEMEAFMKAQHAITVNFIARMAGCDTERAEQMLVISVSQVEQIQEFLRVLEDEKATAANPIFGIRLHQLGGQRYVDYLAPKFMPKLIGGRYVGSKEQDLGAYMATIGMLTSIEGRAIMAAQGYRIEFLQTRFPENRKSNGKRR